MSVGARPHELVELERDVPSSHVAVVVGWRCHVVEVGEVIHSLTLHSISSNGNIISTIFYIATLKFERLDTKFSKSKHFKYLGTAL